MKISNGPLKFGNLHVFEWDMVHRSILRAHHHFGLGLSLPEYKGIKDLLGLAKNEIMKVTYSESED